MNEVVRIAAVMGAIGLGTLGSARAADAVFPQDFAALAAQCAPSVHPQTLSAVVRQESGFNPLAIGVNGAPKVRVRAGTVEEAVRAAEGLIGQGRSIDLGLGQINSANLRWLGLSVRDAFNPCRNLAAAGRVLTQNYLRYREDATSDQAALDAALSAYNTGNRTRGLRNGYVAQVRQKARAGSPAPLSIEGSEPEAVPQAPSPQPQAPVWDVFGRSEQPRRRSAGAVLVFRGDQ